MMVTTVLSGIVLRRGGWGVFFFFFFAGASGCTGGVTSSVGGGGSSGVGPPSAYATVVPTALKNKTASIVNERRNARTFVNIDPPKKYRQIRLVQQIIQF
jgi:hypothetical protein